jgi:hypothetical protein
MAIITSSITYYRSTSYSFDATVIPPSGLSTTTGLFTIKSTPFDADADDSDAVVHKDVAAVSNVCTFNILPTDFSDTDLPGNYYYSIHMIMSDGKIYPFASGKFILKATSTNRES